MDDGGNVRDVSACEGEHGVDAGEHAVRWVVSCLWTVMAPEVSSNKAKCMTACPPSGDVARPTACE